MHLMQHVAQIKIYGTQLLNPLYYNANRKDRQKPAVHDRKQLFGMAIGNTDALVSAGNRVCACKYVIFN